MSHYAFNWFALPPLVAALCSLATGVMLYRREWSSRVGQALLLVTITISFWLTANAMEYFAADAPTALTWAHITYIAIPMLPATMFLYTSVGLRLYYRQKLLVWMTFLLGLAFVVLSYNSDLLLAGVRLQWWGYYPIYGWVGDFFIGYFLLMIVLGEVQFAAILRSTPRGSLFHQRTKMSAIALGVISLAAVDFVAKFDVPVYPFGYVAALAFVMLIMLMERRYRVVYMTPAFAAGQILETMQGAVLVATAEGVLEVSNKAAGELLGYSDAEFLELSLGDVFGSDAEWRSLLGELMAGGQVRAHETAWKLKTGEPVDVSVAASLIAKGKGSEPVGIVFAALDITERRRAEAALGEREEQLRQAQKMEAIGQLAGGIAHDFNNMLTAIIGNSVLALTAMAEEDPNRGLIVDINEVGERAAVLTRQILAFSRRQVLKPEALALNQVVVDLEPLLRRSLGEDVELQFALAPDLRVTEIDRHQIGQVVLNLAVNARDAMPNGGRLLIETANADFGGSYGPEHSEMKPGEYVVLAATDNGCGMDEKTRAHLFEPFFTTKPSGRGTGLGLSTVFGIVKQSGGSIYVYSESGHGTTFKVYMPAARTSPAASAPSRPSSQQMPHRGSARILVVEDEAQVRNLIVRVLSAAGYEVRAAGSGERAETILDTTGYRPELLLTDIVLPGGVNGRQVADRLLERFPGLPVLFMSGYTRNAVVHDGRLDDGIAFLEKPFTPDVLLCRVHEMLEPSVSLSY